MKKIIFICHGSICRSPAAEFIAKDYIKKTGMENDFIIQSRATSNEEIGNDVYPPMKRVLFQNNIKIEPHSAKRITREEYDSADYIFYMDCLNVRYLERMFGFLKSNCKPIYAFTNGINEIEDPWYSDRYELVFSQLKQCIIDIFKNIK